MSFNDIGRSRPSVIEILVVVTIILVLLLAGVSAFIGIEDPDFYCDMAGYGPIEEVPAMCLDKYNYPQQRMQIEVKE